MEYRSTNRFILVKEKGMTHPIQKNHDAPTLASYYRIGL